MYKLFTFLRSGTHTMTKKDGKTKEVNCEFYECKLKQCGGCRVKNCEAIKVVMKGTGGLLRHVKACRGDAVYDDVRSSSKSSNVYKAPDGQLVEQLPFKELLPHHVRFVIFCFTHWDHFSKTRAPQFVLEFVQGWDPRAGLPARETCVRILFLIQHMIRKKLTALYALVRAQLGSPFCGMLDDIYGRSVTVNSHLLVLARRLPWMVLFWTRLCRSRRPPLVRLTRARSSAARLSLASPHCRRRVTQGTCWRAGRNRLWRQWISHSVTFRVPPRMVQATTGSVTGF